MLNTHESSLDEEIDELGVLEVVRDVGHADLLARDLVPKQNLRVTALAGSIERNGEEHVVHLSISDADASNELPGGLLIIRRFVDEENSARSEKATKDLQRVEDVAERLLMINLTVGIPESASVDERVAATDQRVKLLLTKYARQLAPLRQDRLVVDAAFSEIPPE